MDADYSRAVQRTFVDLYRKGLIYRGRRMVNWDPVALTALSDEEVIPTPQKVRALLRPLRAGRGAGTFHRGRHHPAGNDHGRRRAGGASRRRALSCIVRQESLAPARSRAACRSSAMQAIDPEFRHRRSESDAGARQSRFRNRPAARSAGHRCPASERHDQLSRRPELDGLDRFVARKKAAEMLAESGLLAKEEPHESTVGFSERAGVPIEPRLSEQWFLKYPRVAGSARGGRTGESDSFSPGALGSGLPTLAGEHSGLVHQPPALVGPSHSGLVSEARTRNRWQSHPRRHRAAVRRGELGAGPRRARHLVFELALAVRNDGSGPRGRNFIRRAIS